MRFPRALTCILLSGLAIVALSSPVIAADPPSRPDFDITTDDRFDPGSIPAYRGNHDEIYAYIDANLDDHVGELQRWVRQPSISAQDIGIVEMATMVRDDLERIGFTETELVETDGHPGVWGYYDAGADKTLMMYMMYDVQPVDEDDWQTPPFAGNIVDHERGRVLMARGATNQKGPQRALLNAIASIIETTGTLPVNLMVTAEGEEELGSPHYPQIVDKFEQRLMQADGVLFPFNSQSPDGNVLINLGVKGILYVEMEAKGGAQGGPTKHEIHGSYKAIVDAPALRLIQAIASLTTPDGNTITVPGYYDGIRPPTPEEQRLINGMLADWDDEQLQQALGVQRWIDGQTGLDAIMEYLYMPTLNVDGIWSGYTGEGSKTILPHIATAKVDSRLPLGLDPEQALAKIREHLDHVGFDDIEIRKLGGYPGAQTSVDAALVQAAIGVFNKRGIEVSVRPRLAGSAPFYQFTERLGLPLVFAALGYGTGAHGPDEFMVIEAAEGSRIAGLADIEKYYVDLLYALSEH